MFCVRIIRNYNDLIETVLSTKIEFNPEFKQALEFMDKGDQHLFITGKAGTGKSTLLDYFCSNTKKNIVVLAPTGVAALNVKGQTIHSFFNFYVDVTVDKINNKKVKPRSKKIYSQLDAVIIDEISMVRADLLDCIDAFLKLYGPKADAPFGGIQMIFVGDLYQLPPVVPSAERELFTDFYRSPYFFSAHAFSGIKIKKIEMDKIYRQKDQSFIDMLNKIRNNSVSAQDLKSLNTRYIPDFAPEEDIFYISLTTTNKKADLINDENIDNIEGAIKYSEAEIDGDFGKEYYPTAVDLQYKIGAQIMMLNNDVKRRWVNGSIGVIVGIKDKADEEYLVVKLQDCKRLVTVERHKWQVFKFKVDGKTIVSEPVGTFTQYPFRLAWAVTIHKSQGKTFDNVIIDISQGTFVSGQAYVAFSRCTSFDGIVLKAPVKKYHIKADNRLMQNFRIG
jgi:ATP-dependent DNA helicase PIF1